MDQECNNNTQLSTPQKNAFWLINQEPIHDFATKAFFRPHSGTIIITKRNFDHRMLYLDYIISKRNAATVSVIRFSNVWVVRTLVR